MKEFTEDEKVVARNINREYKWMARDSDGELCVFMKKPAKLGSGWNFGGGFTEIFVFNHMFGPVRWEDDEPTPIKDIYDPRILNDAEIEYLKAVLKPFHEKIEYVAKYGDEFADDGTYHKEFLFISYSYENRDKGDLTFPDFDAGKAYSGMELGKRYKLGELGIIYTDTEEAKNE